MPEGSALIGKMKNEMWPISPYRAAKQTLSVARGPCNTPLQNLDRLQFLNLVSGQIRRVTSNQKKKGERVTVTL